MNTLDFINKILGQELSAIEILAGLKSDGGLDFHDVDSDYILTSLMDDCFIAERYSFGFSELMFYYGSIDIFTNNQMATFIYTSIMVSRYRSRNGMEIEKFLMIIICKSMSHRDFFCETDLHLDDYNYYLFLKTIFNDGVLPVDL